MTEVGAVERRMSESGRLTGVADLDVGIGIATVTIDVDRLLAD